jgi:hypothetical protein
VNLDGLVTPLDALRVINRLNLVGPHEVYDRSSLRHDVSRDGHVAPLDALLVINRLNRGLQDGEGEAEPLSGQDVLLTRLSTDVAAPLTTADEVDVPLIATAANVEDDWRLLVGEGSDVASLLDDISPEDDDWESLMRCLAEDVLEAWMDAEED